MPRVLVLGNGRMLVNFDDTLSMRDLYYPRVGMSNHILGHKNRIGIWVDGRFSWIDGPDWIRHSGYEEESLIGFSSAIHQELQISLLVEDAVDFRSDLFVKYMRVVNLASHQREVRIFFTHDFSIDESDIGDTSLYDPGSDALLHYKRDIWFLMGGRTGDEGIFQYANGRSRFRGAEGTWKDAEDGWLEGNPIAQGAVDSCMSFRLEVEAEGEEALSYWIAAGRDLETVRRLHRKSRREGVGAILDKTRSFWRSWLGQHRFIRVEGLSDEAVALFKRSLLIARSQIDQGGGILAANDSDIIDYNRDDYSYVWPRDGAFVSLALDAAGYSELTKAFYLFCHRGISPGGFLWHKYHPDGSLGSSWHPWIKGETPQLPIQEDETALVLYALGQFYERQQDIEFIESIYQTLIRPAGLFLAAYRDTNTGLPLESYDLWEERRGVFTFTCSAVWAGLKATARFAELFGDDDVRARCERAADEVKEAILTHLYSPSLGRFLRGISFADDEPIADDTLESSAGAVHVFGVLPPDDPRVVATMEQIEEGLAVQTAIGGIARYEGDPYFGGVHDAAIPGNPWIICTLWVADWHIAKARQPGDLAAAREIIEWTVGKALPSGVLPEQLHPETGEPLSVAPLTWSHSSYVHTILRYQAALQRMEEALAPSPEVSVKV